MSLSNRFDWVAVTNSAVRTLLSSEHLRPDADSLLVETTVRCLVKMQKRGQDNCPQCRSAVVLRANASTSDVSPEACLNELVADHSPIDTANLDQELQKFLLRWFPHEVKDKEKSNNKEAAKEELEEMGIPDRKCTVM